MLDKMTPPGTSTEQIRSSPRDSKASSIIGYFCIGGASLFWAISASMGRAVFLGRFHLFGTFVPFVSPLMLTQSRVTLAACVMFPALLLARGRTAVSMKLIDIRDCMIVGTLGIAASNYLNYLSIQRTNVATAIILQYQAPVLVLCWMLLRKLQRPTFLRITGVLVSVVGSVLAIGIVSQSVHFPWLAILPGQIRFDVIGVVAALLAAVAFAFYNVFGRHLVKAHDPWTVLAWSLAGAAIGWVFINPPWKVIAAHYTSPQWGFMGLFSITSILIPFALYSTGLHHLDATRAIVISCLQPVFSVLIAAVTLGELVGKIQTAGILLVLASTILVQLETQQGAPAPPPREPAD
jgi:drug/metabolite transporter (DMT)-like permease